MKKFLVVVAALACMGSIALAGPNANGTLIVHDPQLQYTEDTTSYCGLGVGLTDCCQSADTRIDGSSPENIRVWKVYAAFCPGSSPRLKGVAFGIHYNPNLLIIVARGNCCGDPNQGAQEYSSGGWPGTDTGTSLVFQNTQTGCSTECYWFAGYAYDFVPSQFCLRDCPGLGGNFADDEVPPVLDRITCYSCMGFEMDGLLCCPRCEGACCIPPYWECYIMTEEECIQHEGIYKGDGTTCNPNPCPGPVPIKETTWGRIKATYR